MFSCIKERLSLPSEDQKNDETPSEKHLRQNWIGIRGSGGQRAPACGALVMLRHSRGLR